MGDHTQKMAFSAGKDHKKTHSAAAERAQMIWRDLARALTVGHLDHVPGLGTSSVLMVFRGATLLISSLEPVLAAGRGQTWSTKTEGDHTRQILAETC